METEKENPSDYPNVTYWAFRKIEKETQDFEQYRPEDDKVWFPEGKSGWKPAKDIEIIIKVTFLKEIKTPEGKWINFLWKAEIYGSKVPLSKTGIELRKIEALQSEAFAVAAGFVGSIQAYTNSGWFATGS